MYWVVRSTVGLSCVVFIIVALVCVRFYKVGLDSLTLGYLRLGCWVVLGCLRLGCVVLVLLKLG